jgi:hypothetical protein
MRRGTCILATALVASVAAVPEASASTLVDRGASAVQLKANGRGVGLITYRRSGATRRVLAWGAINMGRLAHRLDYSGQHKGVGNWRSFRNTCRPYSGPPLQYVTAACTLPDGSHWAVQQWARIKPNFGGASGAIELPVSHWSGPVANLEIHGDWSKHHGARGHYHHLFGRYTYQGRSIFGRRSTPTGAPLDRLGRNIYIESLNSDMGAGWRRVNGFLSRSPRGQFCFEFGPKAGYTNRTGRSSANQYRALVAGPGVTPDVVVAFAGPGDTYDRAWDRQMNALQRQLVGSRARGCGDPGGRDA